MLQRMYDVVHSSENKVVGGCQWHRHFGWKPGESVAYTRGSGVPQPDGVAPVCIQCGAGVPAVRTIRGPGRALAGLDVHEHSDARRCQRRSIKIEVPVHLDMGGQFGVDPRAVQQV